MRKWIIIGSVLIVSTVGISYADDRYIIRPNAHDFTPNDGFMDAGSHDNPLIIRDQYGNRLGTMQTDLYDHNPGDGFNEKGSQLNPWIFRPDRDYFKGGD